MLHGSQLYEDVLPGTAIQSLARYRFNAHAIAGSAHTGVEFDASRSIHEHSHLSPARLHAILCRSGFNEYASCKAIVEQLLIDLRDHPTSTVKIFTTVKIGDLDRSSKTLMLSGEETADEILVAALDGHS